MNRTALKLLASGLLAFFILYFSRNYLYYDDIALDSTPWSVFFSSFGVIYAIIAGFLILSGLEKYNSLNELLELELNSIQDIRDYLYFLDKDQNKTKLEIIEALKSYLCSVMDREWPQMASKNSSLDSDTSPELYKLILSTDNLKSDDENDKIVLPMLIGEITKITSTRTTRIAKSYHSLPILLKLLMGFMSIILIVGLIFISSKSLVVHSIIVVSQSVSIHLLYMIIIDLDNPFFGVYSINKSSFQRLYKKLDNLDITKGI